MICRGFSPQFRAVPGVHSGCAASDIAAQTAVKAPSIHLKTNVNTRLMLRNRSICPPIMPKGVNDPVEMEWARANGSPGAACGP